MTETITRARILHMGEEEALEHARAVGLRPDARVLRTERLEASARILAGLVADPSGHFEEDETLVARAVKLADLLIEELNG